MSRTTLLTAGADGDMRAVKEYSNAWWGAMAVWTFMVERYLRPAPGSFWLADAGMLRQLWDLAGCQDIPFVERVMLATTFDRSLVRGNERQLLFHCLKSSATRLPAGNHLDAQAEDILALPAETRAVGWRQTSVAQNLWWVEGPDDSEDRPYNIDIDTNHWWLFDQVTP